MSTFRMLLVVSNLTVGLISAFEGAWDRASFFAIMGVGLTSSTFHEADLP